MRSLMIVALALGGSSDSAKRQSNLPVAPQQSASELSAPPKQETLADALAAVGLKPPSTTIQHLDHPITSYAVLSDRDTYLIAYYWKLPSGMLEDPLRVLTLNKQTGEWKSAELMLGGEQIGHGECVGSVLHAHALSGAFLLDTHINPSAGCLLVLKRNLAFQNALYGWYLAALSDTQIVFQRGEVHFAPEHPAELTLYDLKTNRETALFPRKPFQNIRRRYTEQLREFYRTHKDWCNKNNDPCDPENADSTLHGEVAVNEREDALAFVISYDRIQPFAGPVQTPEGPGRVVYVYRYLDDETKLDYREMLLSDVQMRFGKLSLRDLLEPVALQEIFREDRWHQVFQGRLAKVEVDRTLYERRKDENCFIAVRVTNVTTRPLGVDLRRFWNVIYPNSWGFSKTPAPGLVDEERIIREPISPEDKNKLKLDFADGRLTAIMPNSSINYFREFTIGRNIRKEIDSAGDPYLIVGLDGALQTTDGQTTEEMIFQQDDGVADDARWVVIRLPAHWQPISQNSVVVEVHP